MAVSKGVNSYSTVAEADAYFEDRLDVAAWTSAAPDQKGRALVTATMLFDQLDWQGSLRDPSQPLAFPRRGLYYSTRAEAPVEYTEQIPRRVLSGFYEMAYHLLNNDGLLDDSGGVDSLSVGGIALTKIRDPSKFPGVVKKLLRDFVKGGLAGTPKLWWRVN